MIKSPVYLILASILLLAGCARDMGPEKSVNPLDFVDPMIGTGFHGHTFPGAVVPFGRVQLSPDTRLNGWDACSGYHYSDSTIYGFSHTHLSGTGIGDMGDVLFLPFTGPIPEVPLATFSHENEEARPGYYRVQLNPWDVSCELTSTLRTGWHRYTYPQEEKAGLLIDLAHILQSTWGNMVLEASIKVVDDKTIEGYRLTSGWAAYDPIWFRAEFDVPFEVQRLEVDGQQSQSPTAAEGKEIRLWLSFGALTQPLGARVAVSAVDESGPRVNMKEVAHLKTFDEVYELAAAAWSQTLSSILVSSSDTTVFRNFYTALYHAHLAPMVFNDADGRYLGMDKNIYQAQHGEAYTVFSLWDTFRAWFPLMTIVEPLKARQWVYSLYDSSLQGGLLPKWPLCGSYTGTMVGYPAVALMADAMTKGLLDSIPDQLIDAARRSASWQPQWHQKAKGTPAEGVMPEHIMYKEQNGFVPVDKVSESVSWGLEMAYYDWCLAQMALSQGQPDVAEVWSRKGLYYRQYFDPSVGFMRGRMSDGSWYPDFNPNFSSHMKSEYVEGNAWQWSPFVPHDVEGLRDLMGGPEAMGIWMDTLFTTSSVIEGEEASGDITGLIGQYAHGNEPSHHVAYLYNYTDRPQRTAEVVDTILYNFYQPTPEGIIGNEDCGQMSSWYVLSAMGFYQVAPGKPLYDLGRPIVDEARIKSGDGWFTVRVHNNSRENCYVERTLLNGKLMTGLQFSHEAIRAGGLLEFFMTSEHGSK